MANKADAKLTAAAPREPDKLITSGKPQSIKVIMIQNKENHKKLFSTVLWTCAIGVTMMLRSANAISSEIPAEFRYKNQNVTLPPEVMALNDPDLEPLWAKIGEI